MSVLLLAIAFVAAFMAGAINSVAGGGTLITYSTLNLLLDLPSKAANATNTMALWPASLAGTLGFRKTRPPSPKIVASFVITSAFGGATGAALLRQTSESQFKIIVPWLILMAALLFLLQGTIAKKLGIGESKEGDPQRSNSTWALVLVFQFFVGVYGGYFGAGIGIIMLAALSYMRVGDIYHMSFLKNFSALAINCTAAGLLGLWGMVDWPIAGIMACGALLGGFFGTGVAKRIGAERMRTAISVIGMLIAGYMMYNQFRPKS